MSLLHLEFRLTQFQNKYSILLLYMLHTCYYTYFYTCYFIAAYLFIQITKDTAVAEETKAVVQKEENEAAEKARETQAIADDAQRDLNEALPALVCTVTTDLVISIIEVVLS